LLRDGRIFTQDRSSPVAGFWTHGQEGQLLSSLALRGREYAPFSLFTESPAGDIWFGARFPETGEVGMIKLDSALREQVVRRLPFDAKSLRYPDGRVVVDSNGFAYWVVEGRLTATTENALLHSACGGSERGLAVLTPEGAPAMFSFLPGIGALAQARFERDSIFVGPLMIDLNPSRPRLACAVRQILAPGDELVLMGGGFGPGEETPAQPENGRYGSRLGGLQVKVDGLEAPIESAGPNLVRARLPFSARGGRIVLEQDGVESNPLIVTVTLSNPVLARTAVDRHWSISPAVNAAYNPDGSLNNAASPAYPGEILTLYVTGAGEFEPSLPDGIVVPEGPSSKIASLGGIAGGRGNFRGNDLPIEIVDSGPVPGMVAGQLARIRFRTLLPESRLGYPSAYGVRVEFSRDHPLTQPVFFSLWVMQ
jgi:uncharacterized protein (TIGR03437 family)